MLRRTQPGPDLTVLTRLSPGPGQTLRRRTRSSGLDHRTLQCERELAELERFTGPVKVDAVS